MENTERFLGLSDHSRIVKRHRARRARRPPSPRGSAATSSSSVGGDFPVLGAGGEEDADLANCLILLAQGGGLSSPSEREGHQDQSTGGSEKSDSATNSVARSKKVSELSVIYECKTCNRVFQSFQALGGHRASHSKPGKGIGVLEDRNRSSRDHDRDRGDQIYGNTLSPNPAPILSQLQGISSLGARTGKVHECSVCGSEFASGQALGGHMRRHRSSVNSSDDATGVSIIRPANDSNSKPRKLLSLDLNLPAPEDDDERDSMFGYGPSQSVRPLLFSASALVDCLY